MKSPFRRRRRRRSSARRVRPAQAPAQPEVVDWSGEGAGRSLMSTLRGDAEAGTGFGAGMFEELHAMFSGGKRIQIEEQEAEKMRRHDDHRQTGDPNRPDLDSGIIRIHRAATTAGSAGTSGAGEGHVGGQQRPGDRTSSDKE